jgi:hypothetical protein
LFGEKSEGKRKVFPSTPRRYTGRGGRVPVVFKIGNREGLKNIRRRCDSRLEEKFSEFATVSDIIRVK